MPVEILLERRAYGFIPATPHDEEEMNLFAIGAQVKAKIVRSKSRPMLRFYWAVVEEIANGVGMGKVELSQQLLCATRRLDSIQVKGEGLFFVPKRISRMDHVELRDYVEAAFELLFRDYAPGSQPEVFAVASRKAQTTYRDAINDLEREGKK